MGTVNDDYVGSTCSDSTCTNPFNMKKANYGPLYFDHTHILVFNYVYNLPKFIQSTSGFGRIGKAIVNDWQVSGITTMMTGQPDNITFSITGISNLPERYNGFAGRRAPRSLQEQSVLSEGVVPMDERFGTRSSSGGEPRDLISQARPIRRPGDHDWDVSIFKNFQLPRESMKLQLRMEMFNAWNHPRFNDFNRAAQFDASGNLVNTPSVLGGTGGRFGFGALTDTADPRRIQLAAKLYF